jgi:hypothetical protein
MTKPEGKEGTQKPKDPQQEERNAATKHLQRIVENQNASFADKILAKKTLASSNLGRGGGK